MINRGDVLVKEGIPPQLVLQIFTEWVPNPRFQEQAAYKERDRALVLKMFKARGGSSNTAVMMALPSAQVAPATSLGSLSLPLAAGQMATPAPARPGGGGGGGSRGKRGGKGKAAPPGQPSQQAMQARADYNNQLKVLQQAALPHPAGYRCADCANEGRTPHHQAHECAYSECSNSFDDFVSNEISSLVSLGCASRWADVRGPGGPARPRMIVPLSVEESKPRLIYDARRLNDGIRYFPFAMDTVAKVAGGALQHCFMTSLDDKSAFHHILLRPSSWPLFGFSYKGVDYVWQVLPFGFSASLWVYHTLGAAKASFSRAKGIPALAYLDDSLSCNFRATHGMLPRTQWLAAAEATSVAMLVSFFYGQFLSLKKCDLKPQRLQKYLGIWCDSSTATLRVTQEKLDKMHGRLKKALTSGVISFETLRSVAGQAMSISVEIRPASLYTQAIFAAVAALEKSGRHRVDLRSRAFADLLGEFLWWCGIVTTTHEGPWQRARHFTAQLKRGASDSSSVAWGGVLHSAEVMAGVIVQHLAECQARAVIVVPDTRPYWFPRVQLASVESVLVAARNEVAVFPVAVAYRGSPGLAIPSAARTLLSPPVGSTLIRIDLPALAARRAEVTAAMAGRPGQIRKARVATDSLRKGFVSKLRMTYKEQLHRGDEWDSASGKGDPCGSPRVDSYLTFTTETQRQVGVQVNQAAPLLQRALLQLVVNMRKKCMYSETLREGIAITRNIALFALAFYSMRRGFDISDTLGSQEVRLPDDKGLIVNFQFGKTLRDSKGAVVVLADPEHPDICAFRAVTTYTSAAQRVGWGDSSGHLFQTVVDNLPEGVRGAVPLSPAQMTAALQAHLREADLPDHYSMHSFRVGGSVSKSLAGTPVDEIMRIGGWKAEAMAQQYIGATTSTGGAGERPRLTIDEQYDFVNMWAVSDEFRDRYAACGRRFKTKN
eukprot:g6689.t1